MKRLGILALAILFTFTVGAGVALAGGLGFEAVAFDVYADDNDEGYIDFELRSGRLVVTFDEEEGAIPATMEGRGLPLDEGVRFSVLDRNVAAERFGLPMTAGPDTLLMDVEGTGDAIHRAVLARMEQLGLTIEPIRDARPIFTYWLDRGGDRWRLSVTPRGGSAGALIHLQSFRAVDPFVD